MKTSITRADAIRIALDLCNYANMNGIEFDGHTTTDYVAAAETLANMLTQLTKPRKAAESKAHLLNTKLANKVYELVDGPVSTKDVVNLGIPEITTTQKAAAVLALGVKLGLFERIAEKKSITYRPITD